MASKHKKNLHRSTGINDQFDPPKHEFTLTEQRLHLNPDFPTMWLSPLEFRFRNIGYTQMLQIIGKNIDIKDRKNFLLQSPPEEGPETHSKLGLYTDYSPDFFTKQDQISVGVKGFGFKSNGNIFVQATSDHPHSNYYNGFQFNLVAGDIPLVVLHKKFSNVTFTPQVGVDLQSGLLSPSTKINFENSPLKSINVQINNLSFDWKKKFADSTTVMFEFALP
jgi:hypothetical protein